MCKRLADWWVWRRLVRKRRAEEFRLFSIYWVTGDEDDGRAWRELSSENHALGMWDR